MPSFGKFDASKFLADTQNDAVQRFSKSLSSNSLKSSSLTLVTKAGESMAEQFLKSLADGATKSLSSKMASNTMVGRLGETLIDSLVSQIQKAAADRLKTASGIASQSLANQFQVPVRGAMPVQPRGPLSATFYGPDGRLDVSKVVAPPGQYDRRYAPEGQIFAPLPDKPSSIAAPTPEAFWRRALGYGASAGSTFAQGPLATGASFFLTQHGIGSALGSVSTAMSTTMEITKSLAALQKNINNASAASTFFSRISNAGADLGALPQDAASAASIYLPSARRGSIGNISQIMRYASGYGLSSDTWASQMAQAASLGLVGGAQGSMGLGAYQAMLAQSYAGTSGLAKMGDYTSGYQDLVRIAQANTTTNQNAPGLLQLYTALNKTGIAGLSGTTGAALLGQANQGIVNAPTSGSAGVQMAYYQALGGKNGISPSALTYKTEEGLGGGNFQKLLAYSNKAYGGYSAMDKLYAQSKLFGLNMHQTQALIKAYGSGNNGFSMNRLLGWVGGEQNLNHVNASQLNLLTQLASGKSTSQVFAEMARDNVAGSSRFLKNGKFTGASAQQLANLILHGGTPQSADVTANRATNALQRELQQFTDGLKGAYQAVKLFADGFGPVLSTMATLGAWKGGKLIVGSLTKSGATSTAEGTAEGAAEGAAGAAFASRLGRFAGVGRLAGAGAAALTGGALANAGMNYAERQANKGLTYRGYRWVNDPWNNIPVLGGIFGGQSLAHNGGGWNLLDFLEPHMADQSPFAPGYHVAVPHHGGGAQMPRGGSISTTNLTATSRQYVTDLSNTYNEHLKASNTTSENAIKKVLNIFQPLPESTIHDLDDNLSKFLQAYGDSLTQWQQAALAQVPGPGGFPGANLGGGPGGNPGAFAGGGTGLNTFAGFGKGNPYKAYAKGFSFTVNGKTIPDQERGQIFTAAAGTPIKLPQGAKYDRNLSDQYRSIFTLPNGHALSFMHGDMDQNFKNGQYLKAGTQIGTVAPNAGTYYGTTPTGYSTQYKSTPDIVEFGVYDNPKDAFTRNVPFSHTYDPNQYLASLGAGSVGTSAAGIKVPAGLPSQYKALYQQAGAKYGVPWQFLAAQGFKESSWNPNAISSDGGYGLAQFTGATGAAYLGGSGWQQRALNPSMAIMAQAHYMSDLMNREGGNLWAAARDYNGTGPAAINYANSLVPRGGSSSVASPSGGSFEATLHMVYPNGARQDVKAIFRPKFAGVPYTYEGQTATAMGGRAPKR